MLRPAATEEDVLGLAERSHPYRSVAVGYLFRSEPAFKTTAPTT
jgi:3-methyladenine DNA glycosylase/8-oxoguanine DNA glycosylase